MKTLSQNSHEQNSATLHWVAVAAILILTVAAYWPGLGGPFLFDDYGTLAKLGNLGGVDSWASFQAYVLSGTAGPTGRPLALLSFLLDANEWPADAWPFKRTNLIVHLLNGMVLYLLACRLLSIHRPGERDNRWLALAGAAMWLLHPFLVSTTLYAVQRMAQLSTLFIFLGMLSHLRLRNRLGTKPSSAHLTMGVSLLAFSALATLCKENGVLLPLLVGVIELTMPGRQGGNGQEGPAGVWLVTFLGLPTAALLAYLTTHTLGGAWLETNATRGVSVFERLITEFRVLWDYQRNWFVPRAVTSGVFQDHFLPSRGLLEPFTTLLTGLFHTMIIVGAVIWRRRYSLLSFSLLFFYAAHLLESTVINLELYFEHRNYLASAFLLFPPLVFLRKQLSEPLCIGAAVAIALSLAGCTRYSASVWSSYTSIVEAAARQAPTSARAQQQYSQQLFNAGKGDQALAVADRALDLMPDKDALLLHRAILVCKLGQNSREGFERFAANLSSLRYDPRNLQFYRNYLDLVAADECAPVTALDLRALLDRMLQVPINADPSNIAFSQISFLVGQLDINLGQTGQAVENFIASLSSRPEPRRAMLMAANFASFEHYREAQLFVDLAKEIILDRQDPLDADTRILEQDIEVFQRQLDDARGLTANGE